MITLAFSKQRKTRLAAVLRELPATVFDGDNWSCAVYHMGEEEMRRKARVLEALATPGVGAELSKAEARFLLASIIFHYQRQHMRHGIDHYGHAAKYLPSKETIKDPVFRTIRRAFQDAGISNLPGLATIRS